MEDMFFVCLKVFISSSFLKNSFIGYFLSIFQRLFHCFLASIAYLEVRYQYKYIVWPEAGVAAITDDRKLIVLGARIYSYVSGG